MRAFLAFFASLLVSFTAAAQSFPPTPRVLLAVNPITNKIYAVNEFANSVTVLDAANNTSKTIAVGSRPQFIAINPLTNRIYVNNGGEASVSVIDGATDTNITPTPLQVGSQGPMAINAETNVVYIVRMTSLATDEVTFLNGNDNTWYTIATESFQPTALTINPITNKLYVAHYGTGDVRVISGVFNNTVLHPTTFSIPAWSHPFAIAANPGNNQVYVITEDSRGPIGIINGDNNTANFPAVSPGHASSPKALAVNPVSGKAYALFAGEVVVINGSSFTYVPVATGSGQAGIAVNHITNKIYVSSNSGTLTVIDGTTNATTPIAIPAGAESIGVNPVTNEAIVHGPTTTFVDGATQPNEGSFIQTTITPLPGNTTGPNPTFTLRGTNAMNSLPVRGIYYQLDSREGAWGAAVSASGGAFTASFTGLSSGAHTLNAFAVQAEVAPIATGPESMPLVGLIASYNFTVTSGGATPTVSLASSVNPSTVGQSVTFTASVSGSSGAPTGTVTFTDGATTLCSAVALASGSATCTTSALTAGAHTIAANYSGNSTYDTRSASLTQTVNKLTATLALGSTPNPSTSGQSVTFTATISGSGAAPTGTVAFTEGATTLAGCGAVSISAGSASCSISSLGTGAHTITATYSGNATYSGATGSASQTVNATSKLDASMSLASSNNPSLTGQTVTFTASVSGTGGQPTGTVTFSTSGNTMCGGPVTLASGSASCTTTLAAGNYTINAAYSGNATYKTAASSLTQVVNLRDATITGSASPNPASTGQAVTLTAILTGSAGTPTGTVDFVEGTVAIAGCTMRPVSVDRATCTTSSLAAGTHTLVAKYSGSGVYNPANSSPFTVTISCSTCPPAAPVQAAPSGTVATQTPTYSWSASNGATNYVLLVQNLNGVAVNTTLTPAQAGCSAGGTCSFTPSTTLPNSTMWAWYVKAANSYGESSWSSGLQFTVNAPGPAAPARPTQMSPSGEATTTRPAYTWNASAGASSYTLLVQNLNGVAVNMVVTAAQAGCSSGATCSFTPDTSLPSGTTWAWYVKAANSIGESSWSDGLQFRVNAPGPSAPPAPVQVSPTGTSNTNTPTYTWNASPGATSYYIVVQNLDSVAVSVVLNAAEVGCAGGGTCTYQPSTQLPNQTMWGWYVKAFNSVGESPFSSGLQFRVNAAGPSAPAAPTQVSPSGNITTTMPTYTWNASAGATSYYIVVQNLNDVAVNVTLSAAQLGCGSGTGTCSYTPAQALPANTVWGWYIRAINSVGASGYSNGLQFRTP